MKCGSVRTAPPQQVVTRCRIVLLAHQGYSDLAIADELGVNRHTCRLWRRRVVAEGPEGLWEVAEGRGRRPQSGLAERIIKATLQTKPKGQTHWSSRTLAKAQGVHASTVQRIWREHGLQPHRQELQGVGPYWTVKRSALNEFFLAAVKQPIAVCCADLAFWRRWHTARPRTVESALVDGRWRAALPVTSISCCGGKNSGLRDEPGDRIGVELPLCRFMAKPSLGSDREVRELCSLR